MRKITLLITLIFPVLIFSQSENLVNKLWHCTHIVIDGETIQSPNNDEVAYVFLQMTEDNDPGIEDFITNVCNTLSSGDGLVSYNNPEMSFIITQLGQTLIVCDYAENGSFEFNYFNFFYNNVNAILPYEINTIGDINALTITASNGDTAHYEEMILSVKENQLNLVDIYPNPATETIHINYKTNSIDRIEIYSITGQILKSMEGAISSIDVSNLSQGTYFLKLFSADNFIIKQFVKN